MTEPPQGDAGRRPLVVTWCSARKRLEATVRLPLGPPAPQAQVEADWRRVLLDADGVGPASGLYAGRAFSLAKGTAQSIGADLSVVSGGLGWVSGDTRIPAYDVTIVGSTFSQRIEGRVNLRAWWTSVKEGPFSTSPTDDLSGRRFVFACVSREYAAFFGVELEQVPLARLRIFGIGLEKKLPASLSLAIMPYDARLDSVAPGIRSDFAQRAMRHYLLSLSPTHDLEADRHAVREAMTALPSAPTMSRHQSKNDEELRSLIQTLLPSVGRRRTPMLRHLRDEMGIACEQGRFARLFREVTE